MAKVKEKLFFCGEYLDVKLEKYDVGGRPAIVLYDKDGWVALVATINMPEIELPPDHAIIKDYSENEGIYDALVEAGIVEPTPHWVNLGFVAAPIVRIRMERFE